MGDTYWNRQGMMHPSAPRMLKRPRSDHELGGSRMLSGHGIFDYIATGDNRGEPLMVKDTQTLGSSYGRYLQSSQISLSPGEGSSYGRGRIGGIGDGMPTHQIRDPLATVHLGIGRSEFTRTGRRKTLNDELQGDLMTRSRELVPLPPDASSTLYVEGLPPPPPDSTKREVGHIFRPFVGYKEVRLVKKESKHHGDPVLLCFVDFLTPECAATALSDLQGYKMDEFDLDCIFAPAVLKVPRSKDWWRLSWEAIDKLRLVSSCKSILECTLRRRQF